MLHGIREGVVALDREGRVRLVNDEAARLLGLARTAATGAGHPLDDVLRRRPHHRRPGRPGHGHATCSPSSGPRVLVANRMPTEDGGAVATLRDRTELEHARPRARLHPRSASTRCAPRTTSTPTGCTPCSGCSNWGCTRRRWSSSPRSSAPTAATAEQVTEKVHDPLLAALLVGKATVAAERGRPAAARRPATCLPDRLVDPRGLVTVVGNLVDNALDAGGGPAEPLVEVELRAEGRTAVLRVRDSGPGVPAAQPRADLHRGLVDQAAPGPPRARARARAGAPARRAQGGTARAGGGGGGGAEFTVVLPGGADRARPGHVPHPDPDRILHRRRSTMIDVLVVDDDIRVARDQRGLRGEGPRLPRRRPGPSGRRGPGHAWSAAPWTWSCSTTTCPDETGLDLVRRHAPAAATTPT